MMDTVKCHGGKGNCTNEGVYVLNYITDSNMEFVCGSCEIHIEQMKQGYNNGKFRKVRHI